MSLWQRFIYDQGFKNVHNLVSDVDPSMELFVSHLSNVESGGDVELPNADSILEESETEELISLAQQHLSLRQQNQQSPAMTFSGFTEMRPASSSSTRSVLSSERHHVESSMDRPSSVRHASLNVLRPLSPLEESVFELKLEFLDQLCMVEDRKRPSQPVDREVIDVDLSATYDDILFFGIPQLPVFCVRNDFVVDDIRKFTEQSDTSLSKTLAKPLEQEVSQLHRVRLFPATTQNEAVSPVAEATGPSPSIPTVVEEWRLSDEEESSSLQLLSNDGKDDVDKVTMPASYLGTFHNNSMGKKEHDPCSFIHSYRTFI